MQQKDFILREIEKISAIILAILGKFVPSKSIEEQTHIEMLISDQLEEHYGKDLKFILSLNKHDFESEFTRSNGFTNENIELLADLLFTLGKDDFIIKIDYLEKAHQLYEYVAKSSKTFSLERQEKIKSIEVYII